MHMKEKILRELAKETVTPEVCPESSLIAHKWAVEEIDRLRAALKPFADQADLLDEEKDGAAVNFPNDFPLAFREYDVDVNLGNLRHAKKILAE